MTWERLKQTGATVTEVDSTGSTNADLREAGASGEPLDHLKVLLTRDQREGRGRRDRAWRIPAGSALAVSVYVRVAGIPPASRGWIPVIAGHALARAAAAQLHEVATVGVKWPNDVLATGADAEERKLCGVLAEGTSDPDGVIVGTGINTAIEHDNLPVATATSFHALGATCDEDRLLTEYIATLDALLTRLGEAHGDAVAAGIVEEITDDIVTIGRKVKVHLSDDETFSGTATGIDETGRLLVDSGDKVKAFAAGDVVHVR